VKMGGRWLKTGGRWSKQVVGGQNRWLMVKTGGRWSKQVVAGQNGLVVENGW